MISDIGKIIGLLNLSSTEEAKAVADYRLRSKIAEEHGDTISAALLEHIADEEEQHLIEFNARVDELKGMSRSGSTGNILVLPTPASQYKPLTAYSPYQSDQQHYSGHETSEPLGQYPYAASSHRPLPITIQDWVDLGNEVIVKGNMYGFKLTTDLAELEWSIGVLREVVDGDEAQAKRTITIKAHEYGLAN